jgi:exonuclease 3'-5' domain-containing protein 1
MAPPAFTSNFIDNIPALEALIVAITNLPTTDSPALYLDLEGINLSRNGSVSLISLFISPMNTAYLIDIHVLGTTAFTTSPPSSSQSLKIILENPSIPKVFFDVRNDSDALFAHFGIALQGIVDVQLLELGSRYGGLAHKRTVSGLARCIKTDAIMSVEDKRDWETVKDKGRELFAPEKGGSYEVFNKRPLGEELAMYCVQDVRFLPGLYECYLRRLDGNGTWKRKIEVETKARVRDSQSKGYSPNGRHKALGPWV